MRILQKNSSNSGPSNRHSKSSKKTKATKKVPEKAVHDANSSDSQEMLPKQSYPKQALKKAHVSEQLSLPRGPDAMKEGSKKPNLEKKKQDGGEWKALKKIDYQRLETVMEEGQLSGEESSSKHNFLESGKSDSESDVDHGLQEGPTVRSKKSWLCSLMSLAEHSQLPRPEVDPLKKLLKLDRLRRQRPKATPPPDRPPFKPRPSSEKTAVVEIGEPNESLAKELGHGKRSVILSGMMEILPIFSNEKFVCPRAAVSVEEYEELEAERKGGVSGKGVPETKNGKEMKAFVPGGCMEKEGKLEGGFMERLGDFREITERKLRYKVFTDRNIYQETSSPFINSLLVLTPFSTERERLLSERKHVQNVEDNRLSTPDGPSSDLEDEGKLLVIFKACFGLLMATLCVLMLLLVFAWRWYEPPRFVDSLIEALPMVHSRRSHLQRFFDKLIRLLSNYLNGLNVRLSSSG